MMQSLKIKSQITNWLTFNRVFNGVAILALLMSLFLSPKIIVAAETTAGTSYYVSTTGNDSNPGTLLQPWRSIGKAASMVKAGDMVYIRGGIYNESVRFTTSGIVSSPIIILAYPGENPIIDGNNSIPGSGGSLLSISGDYIYASGIEVRNSAYAGIHVIGSYDIVDNMYVHHCQYNGIYIMTGHNSTVENSRVWRNSLFNEYNLGGATSSGLSAARNGVYYATIRHNNVWENWGEGISTYQSDHTVIEDNITHDNFSANIYISDSTNVLCERNFVYTDPTSYVYPYGDNRGIMMGDETYNPPSANIKIVNNISFGNFINLHWWRGLQGGGMNNVLISNNTFVNAIGDANVAFAQGSHQNVRFMNNLIQQDGPLPLINVEYNSELYFSNNLWSKIPPSAATGPGYIIGDPMLAKTGDPYSPEWYKLTDLSPAIDRAVTQSGVNMDYFWEFRGSFPDIGADENNPVILQQRLYLPAILISRH